MNDFINGNAFNNEQGSRARKLFSAVVLAALDDAIADDRRYGNGPEQIARWARSRDGREVLTCAGIDPNERVVSGLMAFVGNGVRTSVSRCHGKKANAASRRRHRPPRKTAHILIILQMVIKCVNRQGIAVRPKPRDLAQCRPYKVRGMAKTFAGVDV